MANTTVYKQSDVELSNGVKFTVWTTIEHQKGSINSVDAALDNWIKRTTEFTAESFVKFINSKGMHKAVTQEEFDNHEFKLPISHN